MLYCLPCSFSVFVLSWWPIAAPIAAPATACQLPTSWPASAPTAAPLAVPPVCCASLSLSVAACAVAAVSARPTAAQINRSRICPSICSSQTQTEVPQRGCFTSARARRSRQIFGHSVIRSLYNRARAQVLARLDGYRIAGNLDRCEVHNAQRVDYTPASGLRRI